MEERKWRKREQKEKKRKSTAQSCSFQVATSFFAVSELCFNSSSNPSN